MHLSLVPVLMRANIANKADASPEMKPLRLTVVKNAVANLVRGGATAAVAIALPRFLTRSLDPERYAAWSLILQIAAYSSFLDLGYPCDGSCIDPHCRSCCGDHGGSLHPFAYDFGSLH